mmetsp:Transcript_87890/g.253511  ORF Transcript_87890/g.253511 Transcript_87890/m.253511 type:complete len:243 (+) Transcript_87890:2072-2800(+)
MLVLQLRGPGLRLRRPLDEKPLLAIGLRHGLGRGCLTVRRFHLELSEFLVPLAQPALQLGDALVGRIVFGLRCGGFCRCLGIGLCLPVRLLGLVRELVNASREAVGTLLGDIGSLHSRLLIAPPGGLLPARGGGLALQLLLRLAFPAKQQLDLAPQARDLGLFGRSRQGGRLRRGPRGLELSAQPRRPALGHLDLLVRIGDRVLALRTCRLHQLQGHDAVAAVDGTAEGRELCMTEAVNRVL